MGRDGLREIGKIGNPGFSEETSCFFCTLRILRVWILKVYIYIHIQYQSISAFLSFKKQIEDLNFPIFKSVDI